jgi:hypothetical protein
VGVDAVPQVVEVGAGECPVEWSGDCVVAGLERGEAVADLAEAGEVAGADDFALDDGEVEISAWSSQEACTGRWIRCALGQALVIRLTEAAPRWEDPLSVIQNTRSALAQGSAVITWSTSDARIVDFYLYLAAALVTIRQLIQRARHRYCWDTRPTTKRLKLPIAGHSKAAQELVRRAGEQGLSPTGPVGLLKHELGASVAAVVLAVLGWSSYQ